MYTGTGPSCNGQLSGTIVQKFSQNTLSTFTVFIYLILQST